MKNIMIAAGRITLTIGNWGWLLFLGYMSIYNKELLPLVICMAIAIALGHLIAFSKKDGSILIRLYESILISLPLYPTFLFGYFLIIK